MINRGNGRQPVFFRDSDYRWSSFAAHGQGKVDELLDAVAGYEALAKRPAVRRRCWSAYVHQSPSDEELAAIRRSNETGQPFGETKWGKRLTKRLDLDLTVRPRGHPKKQATKPMATKPRANKYF